MDNSIITLIIIVIISMILVVWRINWKVNSLVGAQNQVFPELYDRIKKLELTKRGRRANGKD